jgi:hypothetical protein
LWDIETGKEKKTLAGQVYSVSFSPDGKTLASASWDNTVKLWDIETGKEKKTLAGHSSAVTSVSFSPDGKTLASASWDKTVKLWDIETGKEKKTLAGHSTTVTSVSFSPDGKILASASWDNTVKLWDIETGGLKLDIVYLPGNQWIAYHPDELYYESSLQGDEYGAVRFNNKTKPAYPLAYYRDEMKEHYQKQPKTSTIYEAFQAPMPTMKPKPIRLWWDTTENKPWKIGGGAFVVVSLSAILLLAIRRSDPLETGRRFFLKAGYAKVERLSKWKRFLLLRSTTKDASLCALWTDNQQEETQASEIISVVESEKSKHDNMKLYLSYRGAGPSAQAVSQIRQHTAIETIPALATIMEKALSEGKCPTALNEIEEPFTTLRDPYTIKTPINDPFWFYGRDKLTLQVPQRLSQGEHVGVFGLRKVGKTSLIQQIRQRFVQSPVAYIDCQGPANDASAFFNEIARQIMSDLKRLKIKGLPGQIPCDSAEAFRTRLTALFKAWTDGGNRLPFVIIMDEIDKFFPDRKIKNSEETLAQYVQFYRALRALAQTSRCVVNVVVAYRPDVNRHNLITESVGENPMFNSFGEIFLKFLSREDCVKMIQGIGLSKDIVWDDNAAGRVYDYTGGHPFISRLFAGVVCDHGDLKKIDLERVETTAKDTIKNFAKNDVGNYYGEGMFAYLSETEKEAIRLIAQAHETGGVAEDQIPRQLEVGLTSLENFNLVINQDGKFIVSCEFLYQWIKRRFN